MKAFIFSGGDICTENIAERPSAEDISIAADSGYLNARALGARVDVLVGDLDSLGEASVPSGIELVRLKCEKDLTDTQVAVSLAIERGADDIIIIGGLGSRLDHSLSAACILPALKESGVHGYMTNGYNRVRYLERDSLLVAKSSYKYLSLVALDKECRGVSAEGVKYPLKNAKIRRDCQYAISNEIEGNIALVSVRRGAMLVIESRD